MRSDPAVIVRTVLADGGVAGHAAVFGPPDEREVTYSVDRAYWGRGVATAALAALLGLERTRPLHAHAVADNAGPIRVLQKCGFAITGRGRIFARARGKEIDEVAPDPGAGSVAERRHRSLHELNDRGPTGPAPTRYPERGRDDSAWPRPRSDGWLCGC